jgi:kynurenine aminotransferase
MNWDYRYAYYIRDLCQYTIPQGGYFVMVNTAKVKMPEDYKIPEYVTKGRAKDFAMAYWLTKEIGVVAMYL